LIELVDPMITLLDGSKDITYAHEEHMLSEMGGK